MWNTEVILPLSPRTEGIRKCNRAWCQYIKHLNNCQRVSSVKTEIRPLNFKMHVYIRLPNQDSSRAKEDCYGSQ